MGLPAPPHTTLSWIWSLFTPFPASLSSFYCSSVEKREVVVVESLRGQRGRRETMEELEELEINVRNGGDDGDEKVRVLVVDDSPVDRKVVGMLLKRSDALFEVISADNGMKAMQILGLNEGNADCPAGKGQKIDIILTDYCMPEMTGYDLLKAVKENERPRSIPVVIMSSENDPQRIKRCLAVGAEDFFLKPLKAQDAQKLKQYATLTGPTPKAGTKRKLPVDMITDTKDSARRPRLAGVAVG